METTGVVLWVLLGIVALIVAAVVVFLVIARRRNGPGGGYDLTPEDKAKLSSYDKNEGPFR